MSIKEKALSTLRPELGSNPNSHVIHTYSDILKKVYRSVRKRRKLIHGKLRDGCGGVCAVGALYDDYPSVVLYTSWIDEIATINDAIPKEASEYQRREFVRTWLKTKLKALGYDPKKV